MGSYSSGDYDSSDDDDSQDEGSTDDHSQTGVDDYTGDDGGGDSEEESGSGAGSGAAGAAAGAGAASSGAGAGAGTVTETPEGDDSGDAEESDESESDEGEDEEEPPESPDIEEPDIEREPETEEDTEEEDADDQEDEDDEEEEDEVLVVVHEVDALSAVSWGVQPVMKRVEECYGEEIELFYKPAPVREVDPEQEKQKWIDAGQQFGMPVGPSFWDEDPPESTELVNKAFKAAGRQRRGRDYIRALWRHGVAAGRNINDREFLIDLASALNLDPKRFEEDLEGVELETGDREGLPFTFMEIQGVPVPKSGRVRYADFRTQFTFQGIEAQEPQDLKGFIREHGPVATPEVMEVYGFRREEAMQRLEVLDDISWVEVGGERFWTL